MENAIVTSDTSFVEMLANTPPPAVKPAFKSIRSQSCAENFVNGASRLNIGPTVTMLFLSNFCGLIKRGQCSFSDVFKPDESKDANNNSPQWQSYCGELDKPESTALYLTQLLKDKKTLSSMPPLLHVERLLDYEIKKVRAHLFQTAFSLHTVDLPDPQGPTVTLSEKVFVPIKQYPDYNFVGRILGPRGMTAKQLEQETGCKVMVRGRGSMRDKRRNIDYGPEDMLARNGARSWPLTSCIAPRVAHLFMESCVSYGANCVSSNRAAWDHLNDELHVLITCEDTDNRAQIKLNRAVSEVKKLLIPAKEGEDELKRKQLMELAIINGTYRPAAQKSLNSQTPRLLAPNSIVMPSPPDSCMPYSPSPLLTAVGHPNTPVHSLAYTHQRYGDMMNQHSMHGRYIPSPPSHLPQASVDNHLAHQYYSALLSDPSLLSPAMVGMHSPPPPPTPAGMAAHYPYAQRGMSYQQQLADFDNLDLARAAARYVPSSPTNNLAPQHLAYVPSHAQLGQHQSLRRGR